MCIRDSAYMLCQEFYKKADFYLDLHSGDMHEELHPYVYFPGKAEESAVSYTHLDVYKRQVKRVR